MVHVVTFTTYVGAIFANNSKVDIGGASTFADTWKGLLDSSTDKDASTGGEQ